MKKNVIRGFKHKIFGTFGTYAFFSVIEKSIPFFILPIYTRVLSIEEAGYYILFLSLYSFLLPIFTLGLDSLIIVNYYKLSREGLKQYITQSTIVYFIGFLFIFLFAYLLSIPIQRFLNLSINLIPIICLVIFPFFFISIRLNLFRAEQKAKEYSILVIAITSVKHILAVLLLIFVDSNWLYILLAYIVAHVVFGAYSAQSVVKGKYFSKIKDINVSFGILKESIPLVLHQLSAWFGSTYSRVAINKSIGIAQTGGFGIASTFQTIVTLFQESIDKAYVPYLFERLNNNNPQENIRVVKISYLYYLVLLLIGVMTSILGYYGLSILFGEKYDVYKIYIPFLVFASVFNGFYKIHVAYVFFEKKMIFITLITFISGLFNVLLIYLLIEKAGLIGVCISLLVTQIMAYLLAFYFGDKFHKMPWFKIRKC